MIKEEKQYIPFGLEWYKEMKKLNKDTIISLVEKNCKERDKLREQNKQLQAKIDELEKALETASNKIIDYSSCLTSIQDSINNTLTN